MNGNNALHLTLDREEINLASVTLLVELGVDTGLANANGDTPVSLAEGTPAAPLVN